MIKSNASRLAEPWERRAQQLEPVMQKATTDATAVMYAESRKQLKELIYDKPVPKCPKSKKPEWKRTGNLRRSERKRVASPFLGIVYNDASYAAERHEAGKPGHRRVRYVAHWRDDAAKIARPKIRKIYRDALRRAVQSGIIAGLR